MANSAMVLCERAWGKAEGYVVLSVRDQTKGKDEPGYWRDLQFKWPADKAKIQVVIDKASRAKQDVYWAPLVYKGKGRKRDQVKQTDTLYADLDEADPRELPNNLKPTAWWETSPGRFQALWKLSKPLSPSMQQKLNRRLTYSVGADKGGWGLTKVLRIPGTPNHKYDDVTVSRPHMNGALYDPIDLIDRLEVGGERAAPESPPTPSSLPPPDLVLRKHRRSISGRAKQLLKAKSRHVQVGTRSEVLWELECLLAEAGLRVEEIVALVKDSSWNKFSNRNDELRHLFREAGKAITHASKDDVRVSRRNGHQGEEEVDDGTEESPDRDDGDEDFPRAQSWREFDRARSPIRWLVADCWGEAEVGFISGLPKTYKSWLALDLAVSVATGTRFLNSFQSRHGKVLLIQEEDPRPVMQDRLGTIAATKGFIGLEQGKQGEIFFWDNLPNTLDIMSNSGFQITDEDWMEELQVRIEHQGYDLVIIDPLMMVVENVDEFKAFDMMANVFKPLKRLRSATNAAICVVHHHKKESEKTGGISMYGSVATWAWEESALHIQTTQEPGKIIAERFSKHAMLKPLNIEMGDIETKGWKPLVSEGQETFNLMDLIAVNPEGVTIDELQQSSKLGREAITRQLKVLETAEKIERRQGKKTPGQRGRRPSVFRVKVD